MKKNSGFTIVEIMTVMTIMSVVFLAAVAVFSGRQRQIEFNNSIKELEAFIRYEANELSAGYYPGPNDIVCTKVDDIITNPPKYYLNFTRGNTSSKGQNKDCVYIGKAIQFALNTTTTTPPSAVYYIADDKELTSKYPPTAIDSIDVDSMKYASSFNGLLPVLSDGSGLITKRSTMLGIFFTNAEVNTYVTGPLNVTLYKYSNVPFGQKDARGKAASYLSATKIGSSEKFAYCFANSYSSSRNMYVVIYISLGANGLKTESSIVDKNTLSTINCA